MRQTLTTNSERHPTTSYYVCEKAVPAHPCAHGISAIPARHANQITGSIEAARHKIAAPPFVIQLAKEKPQAKRQTTLDNHRKTLALADSLKIKPCIALADRL